MVTCYIVSCYIEDYFNSSLFSEYVTSQSRLQKHLCISTDTLMPDVSVLDGINCILEAPQWGSSQYSPLRGWLTFWFEKTSVGYCSSIPLSSETFIITTGLSTGDHLPAEW